MGGELLYTFDFSEQIPASSPQVSISAIDYTIPSELTSIADTDDLANYKGTLGLKPHATNGKHGQTLLVKAVASLSNSEKVPLYLTIRISGS
jgi:hypothetical protein